MHSLYKPELLLFTVHMHSLYKPELLLFTVHMHSLYKPELIVFIFYMHSLYKPEVHFASALRICDWIYIMLCNKMCKFNIQPC